MNKEDKVIVINLNSISLEKVPSQTSALKRRNQWTSRCSVQWSPTSQTCQSRRPSSKSRMILSISISLNQRTALKRRNQWTSRCSIQWSPTNHTFLIPINSCNLLIITILLYLFIPRLNILLLHNLYNQLHHKFFLM